MTEHLLDINHLEIAYFSGCGECNRCCDGSSFRFAPLFLGDMEEVYRRFPIVFVKIENRWRMVFILSDGNPCPYLKSGGCTIYAQRPHACRIYPFTPFRDSIYLDSSCPGVGLCGTPVTAGGRLSPAFDHPRLSQIGQKQAQTDRFIKAQKNMEKLGRIGEYTLYASADRSDDPHLRMHKKSLELLRMFSLRDQ